MPEAVVIMTACVNLPDGSPVATIERVRLGGGIRVIEGEEHTHPSSEGFHVRLLSPDRMLPDELRETDTYDEAVELGLRYAAKRIEHAARLSELAADLRV